MKKQAGQKGFFQISFLALGTETNKLSLSSTFKKATVPPDHIFIICMTVPSGERMLEAGTLKFFMWHHYRKKKVDII